VQENHLVQIVIVDRVRALEELGGPRCRAADRLRPTVGREAQLGLVGGDAPVEFDNVPDFAKTAFSLTDEQPISLPVVGMDAVYVIGIKNRIPSEVPVLATINEKVTSEYKLFQALTAARQAGNAFHAAVTSYKKRGCRCNGTERGRNEHVPIFAVITG
jgi:hypothetical protein